MGLRFVLGRAGSGKSETVYRELAERQKTAEGPRLLLVVPEQYSLQAERDMSRRLGRGFLHPWVLSFGRLAHRVFAECGTPRRLPLSDRSRAMVLRRILMENEDELTYYNRAADKPGFLDQLSASLTECIRYGLEARQLEEMAHSLRPGSILQRKLGDLARIIRDYRAYLEQGYLSGDEQLDLLAAVAPQSRLLQNAIIYLDGFYGFTPQEYKVLGQMLRYGSQVTVSLTLDGATYGRPSLPETAPFFEPWDTARRLRELAAETGVAVLPPVILGEPRRFLAEPLAALEREFFARSPKAYPGGGAIRVWGAANRYTEGEQVAREILRLVREEGYRFREVAVLTRDMADYARSLPETLERCGIPCFVDSRRTVLAHPLTELVRAGVQAWAKGLAYEPLFRYLKTGLAGLSREECDQLENYVLARGLDRWYFRRPFANEELETLRQRALEPLEAAFGPLETPTVGELARAVYGLLTQLGVTERLSREDTEDRQCWRLLMETLDGLVQALGDKPVTLPEFARLLDAGLGHSTLGLLPTGVDRVILGDMERTRLPECRAVFLVGVNEGVLPAVEGPQGLFSQTERETITGLGAELAHDGFRRALEENFLIYLAVTKPRERLYLSYPEAEVSGKALLPSPLIHRMERLFPDCRENPADPLAAFTGAGAAFGALCRELGQEAPLSPEWQDALGFFAQSPDWQREKEMLEQAVNPRQQEAALPLGKATLYSSVSRLERYVACPYAYFLQYTLKARERQTFSLAPPDLGSLFHSVLERVSRQVGHTPAGWRGMSQEQLDALVEQAVADLAPTLPVLGRTAAGRYLTRRLSRIAKRAVWTLAQQLRQGDFDPLGYEVGFGGNGLLPAIDIDLPDGRKLRLTGQIDRVDLLERDGNTYVKITDYKSGKKNFRLLDAYYGLQLQLLLYQDAFLKAGTSLLGRESLCPGGVFYFHIDDPLLTAAREPEAAGLEEQRLKALALSGLATEGTAEAVGGGVPAVSEADFAALLDFGARKAAETGAAILDGKIPVSPLRSQEGLPCRYCGFHGVCGFDTAYPCYRARNLRRRKDDEVWTAIRRFPAGTGMVAEETGNEMQTDE